MSTRTRGRAHATGVRSRCGRTRRRLSSHRTAWAAPSVPTANCCVRSRFWDASRMEVLRGTDARASGERACVATIGVFDGVHLGHAALFDVVMEEAQRLEARAAVVTFDPHPVQILAPEHAPCAL